MRTAATTALPTASARVARALRPGRVYRRKDLEPLSTAVDRHLQELVSAGRLTKLARGLYYAPRDSAFGALPPADEELVAAFLKDRNFLLFSPSAYNAAGLGTTQLYNRTLVYNHKRHGVFTLGSREYDFRIKHRFPRRLSAEFLFVDALNNLGELAEDEATVLAREIRIPGVITVERDTDFDDEKLRSAGIRLVYPTAVGSLQGIKSGVLLEVGFDDTAPNRPVTITS